MATQGMGTSGWIERHLQIKEKLFQNGRASWPDADYYMQMSNWTQLEKLEFPDCSFEWKPLTDGTYSLAIKSKDPPCIPDFLRSNPRTLKVSQLHLSVNRMKKIPAGISIFSQVTDVKLDRNKLKSLTQEFTDLKKIKNLDLGNNVFKIFPAQIKEFHELEVLRFSVNQVEEIPPGVFHCLPKLKNLRIGSNRLKTLPEDLVSLDRLEYLKISSNKFTTFPPQLLQLRSIRQVCLSANKITEVPLEFFDKPLELFQADDNLLQKPPQEVCSRGIEAIKSYCRQLLESLENIVDKRLKLMLLGETGAGKTSLCHSLKEGTSVLAPKDIRTVGIDAHEITEGDVTFLTWDFAGQQDYLVTHPVFITKDALVLLVVNLETYRPDSDESYRKHVGVWVENIAMRVPNAVVLVVGTHLDKFETNKHDADAKLAHILERINQDEDDRLENISIRIEELEEKAEGGDLTPAEAEAQLEPLRKKENVKLRIWPEGIPLSSSEGLLGFDRLKEELMKIVMDQEYFVQLGRTIPRSWKDVENLLVQHKLEDLGNLSDTVDQILRETEVRTRDDAKDILRYLHCLGVIIWHEEIDCLKEHVFIDPKRLVDIFKVVVRHGLVKDILRKVSPRETKKERIIHKTFEMLVDKFEHQALLDHRLLKLLWRKADLKLQTKGDEELLVQVLEHFELCFTTKSNKGTKMAKPVGQLDPNAPPFTPNSPIHSGRIREVLDDNLYLFPCYLQAHIPAEQWAAACPADQEQIRVEVKFLPEIPRGFFERLCVRCHRLTPAGLHLWKGAAKLQLGGVETLVRKHDDLENPTIEISARTAKDDAGTSCREDLWRLPHQVLRTVCDLWTEWPGVITTAFSACPRCDEASFTVPLPVDPNMKPHQTEPCPKCTEEVPCDLIYPVVPQSPEASDGNQKSQVNYNLHHCILQQSQLGNHNEMQTCPGQDEEPWQQYPRQPYPVWIPPQNGVPAPTTQPMGGFLPHFSPPHYPSGIPPAYAEAPVGTDHFAQSGGAQHHEMLFNNSATVPKAVPDHESWDSHTEEQAWGTSPKQVY